MVYSKEGQWHFRKCWFVFVNFAPRFLFSWSKEARMEKKTDSSRSMTIQSLWINQIIATNHQSCDVPKNTKTKFPEWQILKSKNMYTNTIALRWGCQSNALKINPCVVTIGLMMVEHFFLFQRISSVHPFLTNIYVSLKSKFIHDTVSSVWCHVSQIFQMLS